MRKINLVCQQCNGTIEYNSSTKNCRCDNCGKKVDIDKGVLRLSQPRTFWNWIPLSLMKEVNELARRKSWQEAVSSIIPNYLPNAYEEGRCDWKYLLNIDRKSNILDFGSGWGSASISMAREGANVVAMDKTFENLEFIKIRSSQEGFSNVTPILYEGGKLPFADNTFDIIILNGVLEWLVNSDSYITDSTIANKYLELETDETRVQLGFLRECNRVLRRKGVLYLAIENRIGAKYLLGYPEEHMGLPFISLIPRKLANRICRVFRGTKYLAKTYTMSGYRTLLKNAGFFQTRFYLPIPDYRLFSVLVSLESRKAINRFLKDCPPNISYWFYFYNFLHKLRLLPLLSNSYSIFSAKEPLPLAGLFADAFRELNTDGKEPKFYISGKPLSRGFLSAVVYFDNEKKLPIYMKINRDPRDKKKIQKECNIILQAINLLDIDYQETILPPKFITLPNNRAAIIQRASKGKNLARHFVDQRYKKKLLLSKKWIRELTDWLAGFHLNSTKMYSCESNEFQNLLKNRVRMARSIAHTVGANFVENIMPDISRFSADMKVPIGLIHGDFSPINILVEKNEKYLVVDWEDASSEDCGLDDICNLLFSFGVRLEWSKYKKIIEKINNRFFRNNRNNIDMENNNLRYYNFFENYHFTNIMNEGINNYCTKLGLDQRIIKLWFPIHFTKYAALELSPERNSVLKCKSWIYLLEEYRESKWYALS